MVCSPARRGFVALLGVSLACATGASTKSTTGPELRVTVVSAVASTLPAGSEVEVTLVDVTLSGTAMRVAGSVAKDKNYLARVVYAKDSPQDVVQLPLVLSLGYAPESVSFDHHYAVSARVTNAAGKALNVGSADCDVPSPGTLSNVELKLVAAPSG